MIRINLLPTKEAERAMGARNQRALLALGLSVMLLFMVIPYVWQSTRLTRLAREIDNVKRQVARLSEQVKEVENLDRLQAEFDAKLRIIKDLEDRRTGPANMLSALGKSAPESLWVTSLTETMGKVKIKGVALDNETIAEFMKNLEVCRPPAAIVQPVAASEGDVGGASGEKSMKDEGCYFHKIDLVTSEDATRDAQAQGFKQFELTGSVDFFGTGGRREAEREAAAAKAQEKEKGKRKGKGKGNE